MRVIEQILQGKKLYLHVVSEVPFFRLEYTTRILVDGIVRSPVMKEDTTNVEKQNPPAYDIVEAVVGNANVAHVLEEAPAENTISKPVKEKMATNTPAPPISGAIETSTDPLEG